MTAIPAQLVKELREATNAGMMDCKRALEAAGGDKEKALRILREQGLALAAAKAARVAKEGLIEACIAPGGQAGVMIEVNCETDFVARNQAFKNFVENLAKKALAEEPVEALQKEVAAKIAEIKENIVLRRRVRYELQGPGLVASYIHHGGRVGVLVEVGCTKAATVGDARFRDTAKDITLHIAACNPLYLSREAVPQEVIATEREIYARQVTGKPPAVLEKIVAGKLEKFFGQVCLMEQGFVKEPDRTLAEWLAARGKELGDALTIRRFTRYQLGEAV